MLHALIALTLPYINASQIVYQKNSLGITNILNYSIPENTTKVDFDWNAITHIYSGYFQNLPNLTEIRFTSNSISDIDDYSFSGVASVEIINLAFNNLEVIRRHIFSGLPNMFRLLLNNNNIYLIESGALRDNRALTYLRIDNNQLDSLLECMFNPENHPYLSHFR